MIWPQPIQNPPGIIRDKKVFPVDFYERSSADQTQNTGSNRRHHFYARQQKSGRHLFSGPAKPACPCHCRHQDLNLLQAIAMAGFQEVGYHARRVFLIRTLSTTKGQLMVVDVDMIVRGDALPVELCEAMSFTSPRAP
jgi:polysaccharide export outer membrane protein